MKLPISSSFDNKSLNESLTYDTDDNYFIDYDDSNFDYEWYLKFIPSFIIYSIVFIIGSIGNILVIFSFCYLKKLQTITNLFLLSLATADLLIILICVPVKVKLLILLINIFFLILNNKIFIRYLNFFHIHGFLQPMVVKYFILCKHLLLFARC